MKQHYKIGDENVSYYIGNKYVKAEKGINETLLLRLVYLPPGLLLLDSWCLRGWVLGGGHRGWVDGLRAGSGEGWGAREEQIGDQTSRRLTHS